MPNTIIQNMHFANYKGLQGSEIIFKKVWLYNPETINLTKFKYHFYSMDLKKKITNKSDIPPDETNL